MVVSLLISFFMRSLNYTLGLSYGETDNVQTAFVPVSTGLLLILTSKETGYFNVPWKTQSYKATGRTESRPGNLFAKINDTFYFKAGKTRQNFKVGVEYRYDWNSGKGYYNDNDCYHYNQIAMVVHVLSMMYQAYIR